MKGRRTSHRMMLLVLAFVSSAIILGGLLYRKYEQGHGSVKETAPQGSSQTIVLLFGNQDGEGLVRERREIDKCDTLAGCVESIIDELVNGPLGELEPTLPPSFSLRAVDVVHDLAIIDLEKGSLDEVPSGSSAEMTTVYSIVDTIALNFPHIKKVKFLMEGEPLSTIKGHLDLREPIQPDFSLEKRAK